MHHVGEPICGRAHLRSEEIAVHPCSYNFLDMTLAHTTNAVRIFQVLSA